ncbi:competence type IV pilus assembly protein ComGB [Niallia sp. 01092]|uniref:competence type IV pilus assembly protein ComGB n=1 Tax=unclassified Niallia TaxID=2837522 RepID=UPI003FD1FFA9
MNVGYMMKKQNKWSLTEQALLLKSIGELLERGYSLAEAAHSTLYYLSDQKQEDIRACIGALQGGESFYENLKKMQFNEQLISYVFFAEKHGGFAAAFQDGSKMILTRQETVAKLKKLLYYPLFLISFTCILFFFVQQILLPKFTSLFVSMDLKKNIFMVFVIGAGKVIPIISMLLVICILLLILYYHLYFKKQDMITRCTMFVQLPLIGRYFSLYYTHIITLQLSYLVSSGFSIYESLQFFQQNKQQRLYAEVGLIVMEHLRKGERLEQAFSVIPFFEKELRRILQHGQENGRLDQELHYFSSFCINTFQEGANKTIKIIQPSLYALVGLLIISLYLAVLLPMFQLLDGF